MASASVPDSVRDRCVNLEEPVELGDNLHELQPRHGRNMGIAEVAGFGDYGGGCGCGGYERAFLLGTEENRADGTQGRRGEMMRKIAALMVCVMVMCDVVPALAETVKQLQKRAQGGNAQAQYELGTKYYNGDGVKKNHAEAFKWWLSAAKNGHAKAQCAVASLYYAGDGVKMNKKEAFKWYLRAAENGDASAQLTVAATYDLGDDECGVKPNKAEAQKWYQRAAKSNSGTTQEKKTAQLGLEAQKLQDASQKIAEAMKYDTGDGAPQDKAKAREIYRQLAEEGNASGQFLLGLSYDHDDENYSEAMKWYLKAAEQGDHQAQASIGDLYRDGKGVEQNFPEAVKWYRKAAEQDDMFAQYHLALIYDKGLGMPQDKAEAFKWYKKSSEKGFAMAQNNLGVLYDKGEGVAQNKAEAFKWYKKAADYGIGDAQYNLAVLYDKGEGIPQNKAEALNWYKKAAEKSSIPASFNLGLMYYNGEGVNKDYAEAAKWYQRAANVGLTKAQYNLGAMYYKGEGVKQDKAQALRLWRSAEKNGSEEASKAIRLYEENERKEKTAHAKRKAESDSKSTAVKKSNSMGEFLEALVLFSSIVNIFTGRSSGGFYTGSSYTPSTGYDSSDPSTGYTGTGYNDSSSGPVPASYVQGDVDMPDFYDFGKDLAFTKDTYTGNDYFIYEYQCDYHANKGSAEAYIRHLTSSYPFSVTTHFVNNDYETWGLTYTGSKHVRSFQEQVRTSRRANIEGRGNRKGSYTCNVRFRVLDDVQAGITSYQILVGVGLVYGGDRGIKQRDTTAERPSSSPSSRCSRCGGRGWIKCTVCWGKKGHFEMVSVVSKKNSKKWVPCRRCGGDGEEECYSCHGKGYTDQQLY